KLVKSKQSKKNSKMKSFLYPGFFFLTLILLQLWWCEGAPRCSHHDLASPEKCTYGTVRDWCRNQVCAKGPGEACGGLFLERGKCGDGTFCSCGICSGCSSITSECRPSPLVC
ncbi:hypothetical protein SK128_025327, partial [Halocaridina rubra]